METLSRRSNFTLRSLVSSLCFELQKFRRNNDRKVAKRFFKKALKTIYNQQPRVVNADKNPADPPAIEELKEEGLLPDDCELRQKKYLNNIIEQDHRFPKKLAKYKSYFQFFHTAWRTLRGAEIMNAIAFRTSEKY